jgi:SAM-dependent methyltransferase
MTRLIRWFYRSEFFSRTFHTLLYCLRRELQDCESVLDLGCGPSSPIQFCGVRESVGVEPFEPYYERASSAKTHTRLVRATAAELDFAPKSFDAVTLIEVIEHLPAEEGRRLLIAAESWAKKKVIVTSPNGYVAQQAVDGNPLQEHLSGWSLQDMRLLGFRSRGLAGLKVLRQESDSNTMGDDILANIRFHPRPFWFIVATLSQLVTYVLPAYAFGLFSVKQMVSDAAPRQATEPQTTAY